ncbi:MAG: hypothetical protein GM45_2065 [actinobacterium acAMD-5]|jgi:hypothetical protein|nr:MAG: hypothetical protein GM45_2065 [actinobacterium acAMD-5]
MAQPAEQPFPGSIPFRALTVGEIFTGTARTVRGTFKVLLTVGFAVGTIAAFMNLVLTFIGSASSLGIIEELESSEPDTPADFQALLTSISDDIPSLLFAFSVSLVSALVLQVIATGVITHIAADAVLGRKTTAESAWQRIVPKILSLIALSGLTFLFALLAAGLALLPGLLLVTMNTDAGAILLLIGLFVAIFFAVWISLRLSVAAPVLILEETSIVNSLKRSSELVKGFTLRLLGIIFLSSLAAQLIGSIFATPFTISANTADVSDPTTSTGTFLESAGIVVSTAFSIPITAIVLTLVYTDLRIRKENFAEELKRASGS